MKKTCTACGKTKKLDEFYAQKGNSDGRQGRCKECCKKAALENRWKNIEYFRAYDRARGSLKHRVDARKEYQKTSAYKESKKKATTKYLKRNPEKYAAHNALSNALRDGKITKQPCEICGVSKNVQAHHDDYREPLCVRWLCPKHHAEVHKLRRVDFEQQNFFA